MKPMRIMEFAFIVLAVGLGQEVQSTILSQGKSVSRINYGTTFAYRATMKPVTDIWYHTFKVDLPKENWLQQTMGRDHSAMKRNCFGLESHAIRATLQCNVFSHNSQFLTKIHEEGMKNLNELSRAIHSLIPTETRTETRRPKKAFVPFIGGIMKSLFGVSTETDVNILEGHVRQMANLQDNQLKIFKESQQHLSSFIVTSNERINDLADIVRNTTLENMRLLEVQTHDTMHYLKYINNLTLAAEESQFTFSALERQYGNILSSLETLVAGFLPAYLFKEEIILETLRTVQRSLDQDNANLRIIHTKAGYYYSSASFIYTVRDKQLILTMQIPLTNFPWNFNIYKVNKFPLVMHEDGGHVMMLENVPAGVAISENGIDMYDMTEQQLNEIGTHHNSMPQRVFQAALARQSCIMAIFEDVKHEVDKLCSYSVTVKGLENGIFHISESSYMLINIASYSMTCDRNAAVDYAGCKSCIITIPANCQFTDGHWFTMRSLTQTTNASLTNMKHTTNLGLLIKFFDNESISMIQGDTLLENPPQLSLPSFKFYESEVKKAFAKDDKEKLSLEKVSEAVKNDRVIFSSLSEAIFSGEITSKWYTFWISMPGIVVSSSSVLTTVLTINAIYLTFKCRQMAITLAVLKEHVLAAKAEEVIILDYFKKSSNANAPVNITSDQETHRILIETTMNLWPHFIAAFMASVLLIMLICKIWKKFHPSYLEQASTKFLLEFQGTHETEFIFLTTIRGQAEDLVLHASDYISHVTITGKCWPYLMFVWESLVISNTVSGEAVKLERMYKISWKEALKMKRIFKHPFMCLLIFVNGDRLQRAYIQKLPEIEEEPRMTRGKMRASTRSLIATAPLKREFMKLTELNDKDDE